MPGDENVVLVFGRKHLAGVEAHPERGNVRAELQHRRGELRAGAVLAVLGVERVALVAIRKAEMLALMFDYIELVRGHVIADPVAAIVGKPQLFGLRVPVETHRLAHTLGIVLQHA